MRLNHPDYIKLVLHDYKKKRTANELSRLLAYSTCAKIKKECIAVFKERYDKKDERVIGDFFDPDRQERPLGLVIKGFDADKFKPLDNYLKGITENTDERNIELLAWLIDFEHRPFVYDKNFSLNEKEVALLRENTPPPANPANGSAPKPNDILREEKESIIILNTAPLEQTTGNDEAGASSLNAVPEIPDKKKKYKPVAIVFLTLIIGTGLYAVWQQKKDTVCVVWENDHYEEVSCNAASNGRLIITMDPERVKHFRKINRPDTITAWSIGKLYYIKNKNKVECYTAAGNFPEDLTRSLRKLSPYIFEKYFLNKGKPGVDSLGEE